MKILVIATGGTIGSVRGNKISLDENNLKILDYCRRDDVEFVGMSPYSVLSEDINASHWQMLLDTIADTKNSDYDGIIILHGSDTLAYTSSIVGNAFPNDSIVLVASDKPIEDEDANGVANFNLALDMLQGGINSPIVCYDGVHNAMGITSAGVDDKFLDVEVVDAPLGTRTIYDKNILVLKAYPNMDLSVIDTMGVDAIIIDMFHSATVPKSVREYSKKCNTPIVFVTHKASADYDTSKDVDGIVYNSTVENAFAKLLLTK